MICYRELWKTFNLSLYLANHLFTTGKEFYSFPVFAEFSEVRIGYKNLRNFVIIKGSDDIVGLSFFRRRIFNKSGVGKKQTADYKQEIK